MFMTVKETFFIWLGKIDMCETDGCRDISKIGVV
jgi:hypothetical protein